MRGSRTLAAVALVGSLSVLGLASAHAQGFNVAINPYVGWYHFDESSFEAAFDRSDIESDPLYGVRLALGGHSGWSLDLAYGRVSIDGSFDLDEVVIEEKAAIHLFYGAVDWHLPLPGPLDVFLSGGAGAIRTDPDEREGATDVLVNYGAGVTVPLGRVRIRADLKDHVDLCDAPEEIDLDEFGACLDEDETLHNIELSGGLEIPL